MAKLAKSIALIILSIGGLVIIPFLMFLPPIGILFLFIASSMLSLPFVWLAYVAFLLILEKSKIKFLSIALLATIILSFKLGILWLTWALAFALSAIAIFSIIKWLKQYKNIFLRLLFLVLLVILLGNILTVLNPFASFFNFFGTKKLIITSINNGNPCNTCQKEQWECKQPNAKTACYDFENIKSCYCCECIKNLKFCNDCFLFWDNEYQCNPITNKCSVGW